jgi:hypothetical protein
MPSGDLKHDSHAQDRCATAHDSSAQPPVIPAYTRRSRYDPPGMSALFAALVVVCVLGASAVLYNSGDGGGNQAGTNAFDDFLGSIGLGRVAATKPQVLPPANIAAIEHEIGNVATNIDAITTILDRSARSTKAELLQVQHEIMSLKDEVADLRTSRNEVAASRDFLARRLASIEAALAAKRTNSDTAAFGGEVQSQKSEEKGTIRSSQQLGKAEDMVLSAPEVTGSIPAVSPIPLPKPRPMRRWTVQETAGGIVAKGPSGTYAVTVGTIVPGLGRVDAIKRHGAHIQLVTTKPRPTSGFFSFIFD